MKAAIMTKIMAKLIMLLLDFFKKLVELKYIPSEKQPSTTYKMQIAKQIFSIELRTCTYSSLSSARLRIITIDWMRMQKLIT